MKTILERFEEHTIPEPMGGCWLWSGACSSSGYGGFWVNKRMIAAHRWAYEHFVGPIPAGMCVCHKCDIKSCCNPDHLFLGTYADNAHDCVKKGRHPQKSKTHCRNGHQLSGDNLHNRANGWRECFICYQKRYQKHNGREHERRRHAATSR